MKERKTGKTPTRFARFFLAAVVFAFTGLTVWAGVFAAPQAAQPTLLFRCMDFKLVEDGSIQAMVRLSAENIERFTGSAFDINFNPDYIQPSYLEVIDGKERQTLITKESGQERRYYIEDNELVVRLKDGTNRSPFILNQAGIPTTDSGWNFSMVEPGKSSTETGADPVNGRINMYLALDTGILDKVIDHPVVKKMDIFGGTSGVLSNLYINAQGNVDPGTGKDGYEAGGAGGAGKGVNLGTLSFRVNPDNLAEMVEKFSGSTAGGSDFLIGYPQSSDEKWLISAMVDVYDDGEYSVNNYTQSDPNGDQFVNGDATKPDAQVVFEFIFPKVLVKAQVAGGDEVTINAYQGYTNGNLDDLAMVLQRYRPEITGTYADATQENFVFHWGKPGSGYTVYRPAAPGETVDYTREDDTKWVALSGSDYTPKGGTYLATQYFDYEEDGVVKRYPLPMEVVLNVTEVELAGVQATGLIEVYPKAQADGFVSLSDLSLPGSVLLTVSPVPGDITLTMPVDTWNPGTLAGMTTTPGGDSWPAIGDYKLQGPGTTDIRNYVNSTYPWVTVPAEFSSSVKAQRSIVDNTSGYETGRYEVTSQGTTDSGIMNLRVVKRDADGNAEAMEQNTAFRTYLPNGMEIDLSANGLPQVSSVPAVGEPYYLPQAILEAGGTNVDSYSLAYYAGDANPTNALREDVRRSINLGGWFYVSIREPSAETWSDLLPVYVKPRANYYADSYTGNNAFDFTEQYMGLFPFYTDSKLPTHVVLPIGYTVATTYDGATGAQPGALGQFSVADPWGKHEGTGASGTVNQPNWPDGMVVTYGAPDDFTAFEYDGFGRVENMPLPNNKQVEIKVQAPQAEKNAPEEKVKLTYADPSDLGITWNSTDATEVDAVTYELRSEGYTNRQTYTLILENTGTTDIYGLSVDTGSGTHTPAGANHFEVLTQPAPYLPVGGKTTFTITYVYNLFSGTTSVNYQDHILITSNQRDSSMPLKSFLAQFKVTSQKVYQVKVVTDPIDGSWGTAKLIKGLNANQPTVPSGTLPGGTVTGSGAGNRPDITAAGSSYEAAYQYVWIYAEPTDEYLVEKVYYMDGGVEKPLYLYQYEVSPAIEGDTPLEAYFFEMPAFDVTVHVKFYEPVSSKLRMSELKAFAGLTTDVTGNTLVDGSETHRKEVRWLDDPTVVVSSPMTKSDSSQETFLVVLDKEMERTQLSITLRPGDIAPVSVEMQDTSTGQTICSDSTGATNVTPPTTHTSSVFDAPDKGGSKIVTITLGYQVTAVTPDYPTVPALAQRIFKVKIVRKDDTTAYQMHFGNSPHGMILNASNILATDKSVAWDAFQANDRFDAAYMPTAASGLTNTYWNKAWGTGKNYDEDEYALFVLVGKAFDDPGLSDVKDSAGFTVNPSDITRSVEVELLDGAATTQKERFAGKQSTVGTVDTIELDLGAVDTKRVENWWKVIDQATPTVTTEYLLRPGIYTLCYQFLDYDGTSIVKLERPLIILPEVGNVDASLSSVEPADGDLIQNRVNDPLGCETPGYAAAKLMRYRVCDVNNDRNLNNIDANQIFYGANAIVPYYLPTGYAPAS